ncbi:HdeD family acid-resistance protein [Glutamicibacter endophyticus]|uniref:HdeD family acid-resistance protein n=1 Tax=Glutamicibacter endophyticus TaxID=1522174 RepID=UPI003AF16C87
MHLLTPQIDASLSRTLAKHMFTAMLVRGILAIVLGLLILFFPKTSSVTISLFVVLTLSFWLFLDGVASLRAGWIERKAGVKGWGWTIAGGIAAILAGLGALAFPLSVASFGGLMIMWFMALGLMIRGMLEIGSRLGGAWAKVFGVLNLLAGLALSIVIVTNPVSALLALLWIIGFYGVVFGVAALVGAFAFRRATKPLTAA